MGKEARVLLAERQPVIKNILQKELEKGKHISIVDSVDSKFTLLQRLNDSNNKLPHVLLLDTSIDVEENFTLTEYILNEFPTIKIIATIDAMDTLYIRKMIEAGICGFVLKEADSKTLNKAIKSVRKGKTFFSDSIIGKRNPNVNSKSKDTDLILTEIEKEVLKLIAHQMSVKEISTELALEMKEVNKVIDHITEKTKSTSPSNLQRYAINKMIY